MKAKELRQFSIEDLKEKEKGFKKELFDLNYQRKLGQVEKPSRFKTIRRDIARIQTIMKEKDLENERKDS